MLFGIQIFPSKKGFGPLRQISKKPIKYGCLVIILFMSSFCEKYPANELPVTISPYVEIESTIRRKYDVYAKRNY